MEAILLGSYMVLWVKAARIQAMGWLTLRYNFCASRGDSETFEPWGGHEETTLCNWHNWALGDKPQDLGPLSTDW